MRVTNLTEQKISKEMAGELRRIADKTGKTIDSILRACKIKDVSEMTISGYESAMKTLKKYEEQQGQSSPATALEAIPEQGAVR